MKKIEGIEFYLRQLKRIALKENVKINRESMIELAKHLEKHARIICKRAAYFAKKERRKIVKKDDIEKAIKEGILLENP